MLEFGTASLLKTEGKRAYRYLLDMGEKTLIWVLKGGYGVEFLAEILQPRYGCESVPFRSVPLPLLAFQRAWPGMP